MASGISLSLVRIIAATACAAGTTLPASAGDKVAITGLSNVAFGTIVSFNDQTSSQNLCVYSQSFTDGYSVTALGSGAGGAFTLAAGSAPLAYDVLWSALPNQRGGTSLVAGSAATGFRSGATQKTCNSGPSASATLTIAIRARALASAQAGSYAGTLQLMIAPE